jgi:hypothetical protein
VKLFLSEIVIHGERGFATAGCPLSKYFARTDS